MDELNVVKDVGDLGKLYLLLIHLVQIYLNFYENHTGRIFTKEEKEDFTSDMAFYMIYEKEIYKKAKFKYFWWNYISRTAWFKLTQAEDAATQGEVLKSFVADPFDQHIFAHTDRNFYQLTDKRLNALILNVDLLTELEQIKDGTGTTTYVRKLVCNKLKNKNTNELLSLYRKISKTYITEFKSCRTKLNELFYRQPPRKR